MSLEDMSAELKEKIKGCKDLGELLALSESEGFAISGDVLEGVSGGAGVTCLPFILEGGGDHECPPFFSPDDGTPLSEDDLEKISGGLLSDDGGEARRVAPCLNCGSTDTTYVRRYKSGGQTLVEFHCNSCGCNSIYTIED